MKVNSKIPNEQTLLDNLGKIAYTLDKTYLSRLGRDFFVLPFDEYYNQDEAISFSSNIRALQVKRWVYDKDEKIADCFKNVMSVFSGSDNSLALVVRRTPRSSEMFFVTKNIGQARNEESKNDIELLSDSLRGNFPGTEVSIVDARSGDTQKLFDFNKFKSISTLCNIPSEKSDDYICQGIDKLLNGIVPKSDEESYYVIILAESIPQVLLRESLRGYQEMATAITPFAGYQFQAGENATETENEMESLSHSESISHSVTKTHSVNIGVNGSISSVVGASLSVALGPVGAAVSSGVTKTLGGTLGYGYSWGTTDTTGSTDTKTTGTNHSVSLGTSESTTYTFKSYVVTDLIEKLEATIKRINESQSTGLWKCASYVLSQDSKTSKNIANYLRSITQGGDSFVEPSFIQEWSYQGSNGVTTFGEALKYIQHFCHPVFVNGQDNIPVTPTMNVSTTELSNVFAFPRYSVQGLPVVECARFGREPHSLIALKEDFAIGCAYHMHSCVRGKADCVNCLRKETDKVRVFLGKDELTKHTFITGSTGSGKSNTIYKLIEQLCPAHGHEAGCKSTHFLVIEPAKGEYKDAFGGRKDVTVYGTNPFKTPNLLQINPFSFPGDVHVLEHIDRLVEVFNACWPMYAAMPAILKESVERAYEDCGWNLKSSKNPGEFPSFDDLLTTIPKVVASSAYSKDTSSDYIGALVTRIRSLTRGIHGEIFSSDVPSEKLFNENVIIDISRVGSSETKALIMGILILKLQEFRMYENKHNSSLRHITVLEEAHNLLRRTSAEQSQESSNLQGKSVEMLANAIAEMRTYGEGFIIADQSPGLMDMSVIRNTNTKIIMRLPDESDRRLVGKAAGLNDSQVGELSRLEQGVAAVSQSDWLEPVLCKVGLFEDKQPMSKGLKTAAMICRDDENLAIQDFLRTALDVEHLELDKDVADKIRKWYGTLGLNEKARYTFENVLEGKRIDDRTKILLISYAVGGKLKEKIVRGDAVAEVNRVLSGKYGVEENGEVLRRVNEVFMGCYPMNAVLESNIEHTEKFGRESNP